MKDIIHTRNSFKTKHRLSARSDDTRIEEHGYSENEEVFEDDTCSRISPMSPSPTTEVQIPPEVIVRYQQAVAEDESVRTHAISIYSDINSYILQRLIKIT